MKIARNRVGRIQINFSNYRHYTALRLDFVEKYWKTIKTGNLFPQLWWCDGADFSLKDFKLIVSQR